MLTIATVTQSTLTSGAHFTKFRSRVLTLPYFLTFSVIKYDYLSPHAFVGCVTSVCVHESACLRETAHTQVIALVQLRVGVSMIRDESYDTPFYLQGFTTPAYYRLVRVGKPIKSLPHEYRSQYRVKEGTFV